VVKVFKSSARVIPVLTVSISCKTWPTQASCSREHCSCGANETRRPEPETVIDAIKIKPNARSCRIMFLPLRLHRTLQVVDYLRFGRGLINAVTGN
jgi:hypothetical protein